MSTLGEVLEEAGRRRVAVGHFNFSELVVLKAAAEAVGELGVPVVMGVSESEREFLGVRQAAALVLKSGVKFALFEQILPKIERLCPRFMQQSSKLHKSSFSSPTVSTDELDAVSCRSTWQ
jgi:hypothetical protein